MAAFACPVRSMGALSLRDGPSSNMSSVFVDLVPLKDVSVVPERGTTTRANDSRRSSADVVVQRVTTYQMSGALGPQRAAQCWGRSSGARSTAASGRRPTNAQTFVERCEIRDQSTPEVDQRYEAFVATAQARNDAREAPMAAALGEPSRVPRCRPGRTPCDLLSEAHILIILINFCQNRRLQAPPKGLPALDFRALYPTKTSSE